MVKSAVGMSALPPEADIDQGSRDFRKWPNSGIGGLVPIDRNNAGRTLMSPAKEAGLLSNEQARLLFPDT